MKNLKETKEITMSKLRRLIKESSDATTQYENEVKADLIELIDEMASDRGWKTKEEYRENRDDIYDEAFIADSVTGNGSGSYTFSAYQAEENLTHAWDLLKEAMDEFEDDRNPLDIGPEVCDSIIRCYLMGRLLDDAIEEASKGLPDGDKEE